MKNEPIRIELPTIYGMKTVNSFLFKEPEPILIDCGENTPESWAALTKGLADNGLTIADIKKVYITHTHTDHVGMAGRIAKEGGAEIWVSEKSIDYVLNPKSFNKMIRKLTIDTTVKLWGDVSPDSPLTKFAASFGKSVETWVDIPSELVKLYKVGDELNFGNENWKVIFMPGHSNTQTIYVQQETKKILSADMLLNVTPTPFYELSEGLNGERIKGLPIMLQSYETLNNIDFSTAYPGHYETINNPKEIIKQQVDHIHKRKLQCFEFIKSGVSSYQELYPLMYSRFTFTAITMLVGYLDLLVEEGKINWHEDESSIRFEPVALKV
jgi:glyoxylase-like metal-dependent hydrolase (beta-lactamase superfamily II)